MTELCYAVGHTHSALDGSPCSFGLNEEPLPRRVGQLVAVRVLVRVLCQGHLHVVELQRGGGGRRERGKQEREGEVTCGSHQCSGTQAAVVYVMGNVLWVCAFALPYLTSTP